MRPDSASFEDSLSEEIASFCNVRSQQKKLVILAPGDMEADSLHLGGEWQFNQFSKPTSSRPDAAFAEIQQISLPEKSPLSAETHVDLCDDLAPVARQPAPGEKLPLSSRRPAAVGAGLQNMGNTCYVNASLQCLTYTPPLANYMLSREHSQLCHRHKCCMLCTMEAHITRALHRPGHVIQPSQALAAPEIKSASTEINLIWCVSKWHLGRFRVSRPAGKGASLKHRPRPAVRLVHPKWCCSGNDCGKWPLPFVYSLIGFRAPFLVRHFDKIPGARIFIPGKPKDLKTHPNSAPPSLGSMSTFISFTFGTKCGNCQSTTQCLTGGNGGNTADPEQSMQESMR
ncbi:PREDICTED: ubiquitin carboxyl-terminal hydrolase 17 [Colobus angolensis palliatus]|uniref:ubiquitin carboxyl-terminal hydrolase 17 n=1 Tax=Colobus angolensis palliatus TaxID=336983 RepID=UPI0005F4C2C7|nr:PREDICTED: ubiquitin carboxyl-terminal hydrolase 17 [Colobus angolensis palliatus]